jgi:RNase P subunit RPR2
MGRKRGSKKAKKMRLQNSKFAINELQNVLINPTNRSERLLNSTSLHIRKLSMKSKISPNKSTKLLMCKGCFRALLPYKDTRVRVRKGMLITTCLKCGTIHRSGGGPKFHKINRKEQLEK